MKSKLKSSARLFLSPILLWAGLHAPIAASKETVTSTAEAALADSDVKPALWVLKDDDTTIYLFGTIHVLRPDIKWQNETIIGALDRSQELLLEIPLPEDEREMAQVALKFAVNNGKPSFMSKLTADEVAAYTAALAGHDIPAAALNNFKPWYVATILSTLPLMKAGYDPKQGVEMQLSQSAKSAGKKISALETVERQLSIFDSLSEETQIRYLNEVVDSHDEILSTVDILVANWAAGNTEDLGELLNQSLEGTPELANALLAKRNENWAMQLQNKLQTPGHIFVAAGAGHFSGEDSVQHYLAKRGLKVERVIY